MICGGGPMFPFYDILFQGACWVEDRMLWEDPKMGGSRSHCYGPLLYGIKLSLWGLAYLEEFATSLSGLLCVRGGLEKKSWFLIISVEEGCP